MSEGPVVVIGAGGHGRVVASVARAMGIHVAGFYDDDPTSWGRLIDGSPVLGAIGEAAGRANVRAVMGIGNNRIRRQLAAQLPLDWVTLVHPWAWAAPGTRLGIGSVLCAGAIVQPGSSIGDHAIINTRSSVDHDATVGDLVHVSMAHLAGGVTLQEGAFLGVGVAILPGITVGAWATVAAGAIVARDVRPGVTVFGNPARELPPRPEPVAAASAAAAEG